MTHASTQMEMFDAALIALLDHPAGDEGAAGTDCEEGLAATKAALALAEFQRRAVALVPRSLDVTFSGYHECWWNVCALRQEFERETAGALAAARTALKAAPAREARQRARLDVQQHEGLLHDFGKLAQNLWAGEVQPWLEAEFLRVAPAGAEAADDAREFFLNTLSDERAAEVIGQKTLRELLQLSLE